MLDTLKIGAVGFKLDDDLTIEWASRPFYEKAGYSEEAYHQHFKTLRQYYAGYPNDFDYIKSRLSHAIASREAEVELMVFMPKKTGEDTPAQITVTFEEENGTTLCRAVYSTADSALWQAETQQRQLEGYFTWMMEEYAGNIYIADMENYELRYLNRVCCETVGVTAQEACGRKCYEVIQGRTEPCPFCSNDKLTEEAFYEWDYYNPSIDRNLLIKDRKIEWKGRKARFELAHDNFSTEFKLDKKDREREAILRTIPGGLARVDARDLRTVLWDGGQFLEMIGYTREQFENELDSKCTYVHPDDLERTISVMNHSKETGIATAVESRIVTRDGTVKILTMTFSYVKGEDSWDGIESFYSIGIDVTRDREAQELQRRALNEAYQTARVASEAKTNFLSAMSHDIRTPMNAIMGMTTIAGTCLESPEKVSDCLKKINTSSQHLLSLINEVLDMSRIESGKIDITLEQVSLPRLIDSVKDMCRTLAGRKHQNFQISVGNVRHEDIVADGDRLRQVLVNLISNAIKYTPEGGTVSLRINELYSPLHHKSQFEFICIDNGIGMDKAFIPHLFEPFSRAEEHRTSKIQGTGLGMAITDNIVRMMNGTITVDSVKGQGSKFVVSVPIEVCGEEEATSTELAGQPVLVVDDDQITCENAAALLNELGMRGYWVLSGQEAVSRIALAHDEKDDFFAVILDWKMPGLDGLGTVRLIRERLGSHVPIIIISAYDYSEIEEEFLNAGADAFIPKPLFRSKVLQVLQMFVDMDKGEDTEAAPQKRESSIFKKRVLLAEDNDINREIALELLRMYHIEVDAVENGKRALEAFEASAPGTYHAVLMDIQMPVMDGYEAAIAIRGAVRSDAATIPIIALTANAFATDAAKARSVGMNDHVAKPIEIDRLLKVLHQWMV